MFNVQKLSQAFWSSNYWLPHGIKWENIEPKDEYDHTSIYDLYLYPIPFAIVILLFRYTLEK